ncbi:MAG: DUF3794 domain-containing protein [Ruminococcaceae bacterium]|nr:DUF3794 domain-containing protein [Oscillospiraceae bacterium]
MELTVTNKQVPSVEVVYDGCAEQPVECDLLLPDYCPDIVRILKCTVTPVLRRKQQSGTTLTLEGDAQIRVYYISEDPAQICSADTTLPFTKNIELSSREGTLLSGVTAKTDYVNCRAISPRRADIRAALSIYLQVEALTSKEVLCGGTGGGIQLDLAREEVAVCTGGAEKLFSIRETFEAGYGTPAIREILACTGTVRINDVRALPGKGVIKGEAELEAFCRTADGGTDVITATLPVSQIVDCEGADESSRCTAVAEVLSCRILPAGEGEEGLTAELELSCRIRAYTSTEITFAEDAYSTCYPTECETVCLRLERRGENCREVLPLSVSFEQTDPPVTEILYTEVRTSAVATAVSDGFLTAEGRLLCGFFARNADQEIVYFEREAPFTFKKALPDPDEPVDAQLRVTPILSGVTVTATGLELRAELRWEGELRTLLTRTVLTDVRLDEEHPLERDPAIGLIVYYADAGERIWDIAKRYRTSAAAVQEENETESEILPNRCMLMIPMVL